VRTCAAAAPAGSAPPSPTLLKHLSTPPPRRRGMARRTAPGARRAAGLLLAVLLAAAAPPRALAAAVTLTVTTSADGASGGRGPGPLATARRPLVPESAWSMRGPASLACAPRSPPPLPPDATTLPSRPPPARIAAGAGSLRDALSNPTTGAQPGDATTIVFDPSVAAVTLTSTTLITLPALTAGASITVAGPAAPAPHVRIAGPPTYVSTLVSVPSAGAGAGVAFSGVDFDNVRFDASQVGRQRVMGAGGWARSDGTGRCAAAKPAPVPGPILCPSASSSGATHPGRCPRGLAPQTPSRPRPPPGRPVVHRLHTQRHQRRRRARGTRHQRRQRHGAGAHKGRDHRVRRQRPWRRPQSRRGNGGGQRWVIAPRAPGSGGIKKQATGAWRWRRLLRGSCRASLRATGKAPSGWRAARSALALQACKVLTGGAALPLRTPSSTRLDASGRSRPAPGPSPSAEPPPPHQPRPSRPLHTARTSETLFDNCASGYEGGAAFLFGGSLSCTRCKLKRNSAHEAGGAVITLSGGSLEFLDSSFEANSARNQGGALAAGSGTRLTLQRTLVRGNSAAGGPLPLGGGVYCNGCALTARNSIFAGNTGNPYAAVYIVGAGSALTPVFESTTFIDNAPGSPSVYVFNLWPGGKATFTNSILWNSDGTTAALTYFNAAQVNVTHSVWQGAPGACNGTGAPCGAGVTTADPQLVQAARPLPPGTLGPDTYWAPAPGSPAIGAGVNAGGAAVDFLGNPRVRGCAGRDRTERGFLDTG
jgi:predicted outer membrane repeat protein